MLPYKKKYHDIVTKKKNGKPHDALCSVYVRTILLYEFRVPMTTTFQHFVIQVKVSFLMLTMHFNPGDLLFEWRYVHLLCFIILCSQRFALSASVILICTIASNAYTGAQVKDSVGRVSTLSTIILYICKIVNIRKNFLQIFRKFIPRQRLNLFISLICNIGQTPSF